MTRRKALITTLAATLGTSLPVIAYEPNFITSRVTVSKVINSHDLVIINEIFTEKEIGKLYSYDGVLGFKGDPKKSAEMMFTTVIGKATGALDMTFETEGRIHTFVIDEKGSAKFMGKLEPPALEFFQAVHDRWISLHKRPSKDTI